MFSLQQDNQAPVAPFGDPRKARLCRRNIRRRVERAARWTKFPASSKSLK